MNGARRILGLLVAAMLGQDGAAVMLRCNGWQSAPSLTVCLGSGRTCSFRSWSLGLAASCLFLAVSICVFVKARRQGERKLHTALLLVARGPPWTART